MTVSTLIKTSLVALAGTACLTLATDSSAQAALLTSPASIASSTTVDFNEFGPEFQFTSGPIQIGNSVSEDIQWSTDSSNSVIGSGVYDLSSNGFWDQGRNGYTGSNGELVSMLFTFNSLKSAVGGFVNYSPSSASSVLIEALGDGGVLLETYDLLTSAPISTPAGPNQGEFSENQGEFRGIQRASNDIRAFRVSNSYVVLDDLTFASNSTAIPTPALLPGLIGLGMGVLRKRKAAVTGDSEA